MSASCLPEFEQVQGEHLLYEYSAEFEPCAESAPQADRLVTYLERRLGVDAPRRLRLTWIEEGVVPAWAYGEGGGYTIGRHAMSYQPVSIHELTHAVMGISTASFFSEGVAVAMEIAAGARGPRYINDAMFENANWDPRPTLTSAMAKDVNYAVAGGFVTYLLVQYGPQPFAEFYRALNGPVTRTRIDAEFSRAYQIDLEEVIEAFLQGVPECKAGAFPIPPIECMGPTVAWEYERIWRTEVSMACDEPGVIGGVAPGWAWPSSRAVTVEVPEDGAYFIYASDATDASLRFGPCFGCPWDDSGTLLENGLQGKSVQLRAGKHYFRVGSQSDRALEVSLRLERW